MATITFGGLATGLDTNSIVAQLTALERRRSVDLLTIQKGEAQATSAALQGFNSKLAGFLSAVGALRDSSSAISKTSTSSATSVLTSTAGSGALKGTTSVTVHQLARGSIAASSATGLTSENATIASGAGTFQFKVGDGDTQSIAVDGTTTLGQLATAINDLGAGVSASVVNIGTSGTPDYRLRIGSLGTGTSNDISIVNDGTTLGVGVTQSALNASLSVSGFADPFTRETNVVGDVIPGVTLNLLQEGDATVTVSADTAGTAAKVKAVVDAFNDLRSFVEQNSEVAQDDSSSDREVTLGPLALDTTVRTILSGVHTNLSGAVEDLDGAYSLLAEIGVTSQRDGTLAFDAAKLTSALGSDEQAVAELFAGKGSVGGVFDRLHTFVSGVTGSGGILGIRQTSVTNQIDTLQERIEAGERLVDAYEANLRATFGSLETLVNSLQTQGNLMSQALAGMAR
jgi:flagellar hook-associated protein 2